MRRGFLLFLLLCVRAQAQIFSYPATPVNCFNSNAGYYPSADLNRTEEGACNEEASVVQRHC